MNRLVASLSVENRLQSASEFLAGFPSQEILLVSPTRIAADELVRGLAARSTGVFGVHRFTLTQLAFTIAEESLAAAGQSVLSGAAADALAARAVHTCRTAGQLNWFEPVATTPGFFRALASTIAELRLNQIDPGALRAAIPSGPDLAHLVDQFDRSLRQNQMADLAEACRVAISTIGTPQYRFRARPLLLLDVAPTSVLECELVRTMVQSASEVLATVHLRDHAGVAFLQDALNVPAAPASPDGATRAIERLRANIFETTASAGEIDASVDFLSATDESRECVEIARSILSLAQSGVRFDEMAIVLRNPDAYQPLVEDALRRAGVPGFFTLGSRRPNAAGRALLALLACASEGLTASRFSEYLSLGPNPSPRLRRQAGSFSARVDPGARRTLCHSVDGDSANAR